MPIMMGIARARTTLEETKGTDMLNDYSEMDKNHITKICGLPGALNKEGGDEEEG